MNSYSRPILWNLECQAISACNVGILLSPSVKNEQSPSNYKMPLDTVLCLDTSGSMGWNNNEGINQLKAAARKFLDGVEETARQADLKVGGVKPHQCYVPA